MDFTTVVSMPLTVFVDGEELATDTVTVRSYPGEGEEQAVKRYAAALRKSLLSLARQVMTEYSLSDLGEPVATEPDFTHADIDVQFGFHTATNKPDIGVRHEYMRRVCRELGHVLIDHLPAGPDKKLAIEALQDVMMRGNRAIAIGYRDVPAEAPPTVPPPVLPPRPVPRPPSAYAASHPAIYRRSAATRGDVPAPRPAADDH